MKKLKLVILVFFLSLYLGISQTNLEKKAITKTYSSTKIESLKKELIENNALRNKQIQEFLTKNPDIQYELKSSNGKISKIKYIIDNKPIYVVTDNVNSAISTRTNYLQPGGGLGLNLQGLNMHVATWDGGPTLATHQEFKDDSPIPVSRITNPDLSASNDQSDHSTHVSGTIVAKGVSPSAKGMAPKATLTSFDWDNDDVEALNEATTNGLLLSNHSYGVPTQTTSNLNYLMGSYNDEAYIWDNVAYNAPYYLQVVSAGNDGTTTYTGGLLANYDKLVGNKNSKNNLVVANSYNPLLNASGEVLSLDINPSSSQGPTDDGRIKPDICADGTNVFSCISTSNTAYDTYSGTSMAAPNVTGTLLLLQEYYNQLNGNFMKASTLKGLVCHTADDNPPSNGPDPIYGWGILNAKAAAETILNASTQNALILEGTLNQGGSYTYNFTASSTKPLSATLCWTDVPGTITSQLNNPSPRLVNDLDLRLTNASNTFYPWKLDLSNVAAYATTGDNIVDTVENIDIKNPVAGSYTITVTHKGSLTNGSQNYSLILTGGNLTLNTKNENIKYDFISWTNPLLKTLNFKYNSANDNVSKISLVDIQGRLIYSTSKNPTGNFISGEIDTNNFKTGIYILKIEQGNLKLFKKFVIR
jgi:serine protease AprX